VLREGVPSAHCIEGWVGLRAGVDPVARREIPCPSRESNPDRPDRSVVTVLNEIWVGVAEQLARFHLRLDGHPHCYAAPELQLCAFVNRRMDEHFAIKLSIGIRMDGRNLGKAVSGMITNYE